MPFLDYSTLEPLVYAMITLFNAFIFKILISEDGVHGVMSDIISIIQLQCTKLRPHCQI